MRRLLVLLTALGLLGSVIGCRHVAGVCDCQGYGYWNGTCLGGCGCGGLGTPYQGTPGPSVASSWITPQAEPLPQMPQGVVPRVQPTPAPILPPPSGGLE